MPCYRPIKCWRGRVGEPLRFKLPEDIPPIPIQIPCGKCVGCQLEYSRQWAVRIMHEAQMHDENCMVTLTYNDKSLPVDFSLTLDHFQKFCKRVRKQMHPFRFFHCGEYGSVNERPHYHACMFGIWFNRDRVHSERNGIKCYESDELTKLWGLGHCTVGDLTFESAAYVARYVMKKLRVQSCDDDSKIVLDIRTGEVKNVKPEYVTMSRRPGIGHDWFRKFGNEVYPSDEVIIRGRECKPPRYYDNLLAGDSPSVFEVVKRKRLLAQRVSVDNTPERLAVREIVAQSKIAFFKRPLE